MDVCTRMHVHTCAIEIPFKLWKGGVRNNAFRSRLSCIQRPYPVTPTESIIFDKQNYFALRELGDFIISARERDTSWIKEILHTYMDFYLKYLIMQSFIYE